MGIPSLNSAIFYNVSLYLSLVYMSSVVETPHDIVEIYMRYDYCRNLKYRITSVKRRKEANTAEAIVPAKNDTEEKSING